ncbi:MAG TPA: right-handed parallel beta-helix repeat-containing protein [Rhizomicrobium sp.]|nr:right-handed parallel beta-helix repeat-containing protein [Rhizomicrobium sp.]
MRNANGRLQLKSKLLIGVAGFAAAASGAAAAEAPASAPPAADPKWLPYVDFSGGIGDGFSQGKVDLFAPVWQDLDSLLFVRMGAGTRTHDNTLLNFGVGYRSEINQDWILGVFGGVDHTQTDLGQGFSQYSLGVEAMSTDWDVRANGYSAKSHSHPITDRFELYIHDTQIAVLQAQQAALSGFDGEVGYRVFHTDNTDVRLFAGGFVFRNSHDVRTMSEGQDFDFKYRTMSGPRGRVEVNVFDLDVIGAQSRVSFDGEVSHDKVRGTSGFAGVTLRIPLGAVWGQGGQALGDLDRRMADPVRRNDDVLTQWQFNKPEPVIIYDGHITSQPTNTLYYVSDTTAGHGSYADPTTLNDATGRDAVNQFVVVTDFGGNVGASGAQVHSGETVVGGGQTFHVRGVDSHQVFVHDFAPNSGTPTIVPINPGDNLLDVGSQVSIEGLNFSGAFGTAIYGHNSDQLNIFGVDIDGTGGGQYGVKIVQDVSADLHQHISNSTIHGVAEDGVYVQSNLSDGGTGSEAMEITDSSITGSGFADVAMMGSVSGGSTLTQDLTIDPTTLSGGQYAILVGGIADGGMLKQDISLKDVTISDVTHSGIYIYAYGTDGADITQHIAMDNVQITGAFSGDGGGEGAAAAAFVLGNNAYGNLITISAASKSGASVDQTFDLTNVSASGAYYDNILLTAYAGSGGVTHQYGTMDQVQALNSMYGDGLDVHAYAYGTGNVIQRATIDHLTATGNYNDGVDAVVAADGGDTAVQDSAHVALVAQYIHIDHATLTGNYDGVDASAGAFGNASTLQNLWVGHSDLSNNDYGVDAHVFALGAASAQQVVSLVHDTVDHNRDDGADFIAASQLEGFAAQSVYIASSSFSYNGEDGIYLGAHTNLGGAVEQNAGIYSSALNRNGSNGLDIQTDAYGYNGGYAEGYYYYSQITQNIIAGHDSFKNNGDDGVRIRNSAGYGGQVNQFLYFYNDTFNHNGSYGLVEQSRANAYGYYGGAISTALYSDLYVVGSQANFNSEFGIAAFSFAEGPTYLIQHVDVIGTDAMRNGVGGFGDAAYAEGVYSLNIQYVDLENSNFNNNGAFGAAFLAQQYFGPGSFGAAIQDVTIANSNFSNNGSYGLAALADASGFEGRAEQNFNISGSHFDHNGNDGIYLYRHAHDGVYYSVTYNENTYAYPCTGPQGVTGGCAFVRQEVTIVDSTIDNNGGDGIYVKTVAENYGAVYTQSGRPINTPTLVLDGTSVQGNGGEGLDIHNDVGQGSYLYQYVLAINSHFDHNGGDGIYIGNIVHDGGFVGQLRSVTNEYGTYTYLHPGSKLTLYNSSASFNGGDGLDLYNAVTGGSVLYQYVLGVNAHFDHNAYYGIDSHSYASGGSVLLQSIVLYTYVPPGQETFAAVTTTADHNGAGGIQIYGYSYKANIVNALSLIGADVSYNGAGGEYGGNGGVTMELRSIGAHYAIQSFYSSGSQFTHNAGFGVGILDVGYFDVYNSQTVVSTHDLFANNSQGGFGAGLLDGYSYRASQQLVSASDTFIGNLWGGIVQYAGFHNTYSGRQESLIEYSYFSGNGAGAVQPELGAASIEIPLGNSIYVGMSATGAGTAVAASQYIIGNTILGSGVDGVRVQVGSGYGAVVYDNTLISGNDIENSGGDGIRVTMYAHNGGVILPQHPVGYGPAILISGNAVNDSGTGYYGGSGIQVWLTAVNGGTIMGYAASNSADVNALSSVPKYGQLPFGTEIDGNAVDGASANGIYFATKNFNGKIVAETSIGYYVPNAVSNVVDAGILVDNENLDGITLALAAIVGNTVADGSGAGISLVNFGLGGVTYSFDIISGNSVSGTSELGIGVSSEGGDGALHIRSKIDNNDVHDAYVGILIHDSANYANGSFSDYAHITYNAIYNTHLGIQLFDAAAVQEDLVQNNSIFGDQTSYGLAATVYGGIQFIYCEQFITHDPLNTMVGIPASQQYSFDNGGGIQIVL